MVIGSVLFAAGYGKRLRPLTHAVPKAVVPILDIPLGGFALRDAVDAFPPVVVNGRAPRESFVPPLRRWVERGWEELIETPEPYAAGGTLAALRPRVGHRVMTRNADMLSDVDLHALADAHLGSGASATLAVAAVKDGADFAVANGRVTDIYSPSQKDVSGGVAFLGAGVYERGALDLLSDERPLDLVTALLSPLVERDEVAVVMHDGYALDVGTPARYLEASLDALAGHAPRPPGAWPGEIIEVEGGRAYRGPGARADEISLGPGAIVLARATIARGAFIEKAIVWPNETVPADTRLREAIWAFGSPVWSDERGPTT